MKEIYHMKNYTKFIFTFCLLYCFPAQSLLANEERTVLKDTIDFCLKLPASQNLVFEELEPMGWKKSLGSKDNIAVKVIYSTIFTARHRSEDLEYTYNNSQFMAASILGNSALKPNQPAFIYKGLRLGVLGIKLGKGYCVLTGPKWATIEIEQKFGIKLNRSLPYRKSYHGKIGTHTVWVNEIDIEKFHLVKPAISDDVLKRYRAFEKDALRETNLTIIP